MATVSNGNGAVRLNVDLSIDQATQRVSGTATADSVSGQGREPLAQESPLPRVLAGWRPGRAIGFEEHLAAHGPAPMPGLVGVTS